MNLDEAIKHCEEVADYDCYNEKQLKCAEEHRQLAGWLKELKEYKDLGAKPWHEAKWLQDRGKSRKCSRCEFSINEDDAFIFFFCPDCGAQMEVE